MWPTALATFFVLSYRSIRNKQFFQSLPLLVTQLNSAYMWLSMLILMFGGYYTQLSGNQILKGLVSFSKRD